MLYIESYYIVSLKILSGKKDIRKCCERGLVLVVINKKRFKFCMWNKVILRDWLLFFERYRVCKVNVEISVVLLFKC